MRKKWKEKSFFTIKLLLKYTGRLIRIRHVSLLTSALILPQCSDGALAMGCRPKFILAYLIEIDTAFFIQAPLIPRTTYAFARHGITETIGTKPFLAFFGRRECFFRQ